MRVYIAGPIKGKPDGNRAAFQAAAAHMARCGYTAVNPHDVAPHQHPGECPPGPSAGEGSEHSAACHLRTDLAAMLSCDAILLLFGWEYSTGARAEFNAATVAGLRVLFQTEHYPECSETVAAEPDSETVVAEPDSETEPLFWPEIWEHVSAFTQRFADPEPEQALYRARRYLSRAIKPEGDPGARDSPPSFARHALAWLLVSIDPEPGEDLWREVERQAREYWKRFPQASEDPAACLRAARRWLLDVDYHLMEAAGWLLAALVAFEPVVAEPDSETVAAEPDSETVVAEPDSSRSRFILFTPEGNVDITDYIVSGGLSPFSDPRGSCV